MDLMYALNIPSSNSILHTKKEGEEERGSSIFHASLRDVNFLKESNVPWHFHPDDSSLVVHINYPLPN